MKNRFLYVLMALLFLVSSCTVYSVVSTNKDSKAAFKNYKTYAWLPDANNSDNLLNNQIMRNNIKNYFSHEFTENYGLIANTELPDVLMELKVTVINKVATETRPVTHSTPIYYYRYPYPYTTYPNNDHSHHRYYSPLPNPYNYNGYVIGYRYHTTYVTVKRNYKESSITINMIDIKKNELVWTVTAKTDIYANESQNVKNDIHPAVHKMIKYFPLQKKVIK